MTNESMAVDLEVQGMTCSNCALGVTRFLEKKGMKDVYVNFATNEVRFHMPENEVSVRDIVNGIQELGYQVVQQDMAKPKKIGDIERKFLFSALFTIPLLLSMIPGIPWLDNMYVQLVLATPVFLLGVWHFGRSALASLRTGVPNMDVLIFIGSTAAFVYSLAGTILQLGHDYMFYETAATIITLVLLGNVIEKRSVKRTTTAIAELQKLQPDTARRLFFDLASGEQTTMEVSVSDLRVNDLVQVNDGDRIPLDAVVKSGQMEVNESMITGESIPVVKQAGDLVTGGTIIISGQAQLRIASVQQDGLLNNIIQLVKDAQTKKPSVQKLADRIAAWFVPVVLSIAVLTFFISWFAVDVSLSGSLLRSIAVLVIACPCAMGLATPTAVMVGLGRSVKQGILIKGGSTLEELARTEILVLDKTGTLTDGQFHIDRTDILSGDKKEIFSAVAALERHSSHPIAKALQAHFGPMSEPVESGDIQETKGVGLKGLINGNSWQVGNKLILHTPADETYDVYVTCNDQLVAGIRLADQVKQEAAAAVRYFKEQGIKTVLLSGDRSDTCATVAEQTGMDSWLAEQTPASKLDWIREQSSGKKLTMVGDGINDSPALAAAHTGVSLSDASAAAIHSAQVVLLDGDLSKLVMSHKLSRMTLQTIKQNLFWAFFYNVLAIPVAAAGFLSPMIAALSMAFSDVIVIGNSLRLRTRKIR